MSPTDAGGFGHGPPSMAFPRALLFVKPVFVSRAKDPCPGKAALSWVCKESAGMTALGDREWSEMVLVASTPGLPGLSAESKLSNKGHGGKRAPLWLFRSNPQWNAVSKI